MTQSKTNNKSGKNSRSGRNTKKSIPQQATVPIGERGLSPCVKEYRRVLANPFDEPPSCVPWTPALSSRKLKTFVRGEFTTSNTTGFGYVVARIDFASDVSVVAHTEASYIGTTVLATGPGTSDAFHNGDYRDIDFTNNKVDGRIISAGLRIRYADREIDRGGFIVALEEPNHQTLIGKTLSALRSYDRALSVPVGRDWTVATWQPVYPTEFAFTDASSVVHGGHYLLVVAVQGPVVAPGGLKYEFEYTLNFEAIGPDVRGKTPSHTDLIGTGRVIEELGQRSTTWFDAISNGLSMGVGQGVQYLASRGTAAIGTYGVGRLMNNNLPSLRY